MTELRKPFGINVDKEREMIIDEFRQIKRGLKKDLFDTNMFIGGK